MEKPVRFKDIWAKIQANFQNNLSRNIINIGLMFYYIIYAILSLSALLGTNEISIHAYWKILILCINLPILVVVSLVLVGKWKGSTSQVETQKNLYDVQLELELKKKDIEYLKLLQQQASVIGDLTEQISRMKEDFRRELSYERDIAEYRTQLAARDGKVPDAICRVSDWNESNKTIEIIEGEKPTDTTE